MGYFRAGFEVVGVDIEPMPNYPFEFHQADAVTFSLDGFDAIHASPPCQRFSPMARRHPLVEYPNLIHPVRSALRRSGLPFVIENVVGAPLIRPVGLCGSMFGLGAGGRYLQRHRNFESNRPLRAPGPCVHRGEALGVYGAGGSWRAQVSPRDMSPRGGYQGTIEERQEAMQVDWMTREELSEAIPPAYTQWIGGQLLGS